MILHIAVYKFRPEITAKQLSTLKEMISRFSEIPGIEDVVFGENTAPRYNQGYTHGMQFLARDRSVLDAYVSHPLHVAEQDYVKPLIDAVVIVDLET